MGMVTETGGFAAADQLADIKKAGVLKVAVIDQNPPFGQIDEATKETTGENQVKELFPKAKVISYDDLPLGVAALRAGTIDAFTQDSAVLVPALANAPDKAKFKILPDFVSKELIGIGVKKGEKAVLDLVNGVLLASEKNGNDAKIYDQWFGSGAKVPAPRNFVIEAGK